MLCQQRSLNFLRYNVSKNSGVTLHHHCHPQLLPKFGIRKTSSEAATTTGFSPKNLSLSRIHRHQFYIRRNAFSSKSQNEWGGRNKWWYVSNGIKIVRIPFLVYSVYALGYQQGLMDYSRNPEKQMEKLLTSILQQQEPTYVSFIREGESSITQVKTSDECNYSSKRNAQLLRRIARVAQKIVKTARTLVRDEVRNMEKCPQGEKTDDDIQNENETLEEKMDRIGISRETENEKKWTFILIDTPTPNAFVTELMPHTIFITTGMIDTFIENDDELGLVLGHEISHLIQGHTSTRNDVSKNLAVLEVLLLSLDPTEGLLSLFFIASIRYIKKALAAGHSRTNEKEADHLGLKIAAMSCFDTQRAPQVFRKMAQEEAGEIDSDTAITHFTDTHPPSIERYVQLSSMSAEENPNKYKNTHCALAKNRFMAALAFSSQK